MKRKNDRSVGWFVVYAVGAGVVALGLLTIVVPGLLAALLVGAGLVGVVVVRGVGPSAAGVVSGPALPLLYVVWLDRRGPGGLPCGDDSCSEQMAPVPWLVAAAVFLGLGVVLYLALRRASPVSARRAPARGPR